MAFHMRGPAVDSYTQIPQLLGAKPPGRIGPDILGSLTAQTPARVYGKIPAHTPARLYTQMAAHLGAKRRAGLAPICQAP